MRTTININLKDDSMQTLPTRQDLGGFGRVSTPGIVYKTRGQSNANYLKYNGLRYMRIMAILSGMVFAV